MSDEEGTPVTGNSFEDQSGFAALRDALSPNAIEKAEQDNTAAETAEQATETKTEARGAESDTETEAEAEEQESRPRGNPSRALERIRSRRQAEAAAREAEAAKQTAEQRMAELQKSAEEAQRFQVEFRERINRGDIDGALALAKVDGVASMQDLSRRYIEAKSKSPRETPELRQVRKELDELRERYTKDVEQQRLAQEQQQQYTQYQQDIADLREDIIESGDERAVAYAQTIPEFVEQVHRITVWAAENRPTATMDEILKTAADHFDAQFDRLAKARGVPINGSTPSREAASAANKPSRSGARNGAKTEAASAAARRSPATALPTNSAEAAGGRKPFQPDPKSDADEFAQLKSRLAYR